VILAVLRAVGAGRPEAAARATRNGRRSPERAPPLAVGTPDMDPLDRVIARAYLDAAFRALLLRWPGAALRGEHLPDELRERLSAIRAVSLPEFASIALRGYRRLRRDRPAP
jgi:hypothetical protein